MKSQILVFLLLVLASGVSGCTGSSVASSTVPATQASPAAEAPMVEDKAGLTAALQAVGATVETGELVSQAFFSPEGTIIKVNGADVQVFEYESVEAMEEEASQVTPDGDSIGTTMVTWVDTPHFYKAGRIIALYVGSDGMVLDLLEEALGPQFAGR